MEIQKKSTPHPDPLPQGEREKKGVIKKLRLNATEAEKFFWQKIRDRQIEGYKFRRQCLVGEYIVDFVCFEGGLVIELDGGQHCENVKDILRDECLLKRGFRVIRFWNNEVLENMDGVLTSLSEFLKESPSPLAGEGRGEGYAHA